MLKPHHKKNESVEQLKRRFLARYNTLIIALLGMFSFMFYFLFDLQFIGIYMFAYFCIHSYTWVIIRNNYNIEKFIHNHAITGSIFLYGNVLMLWKHSLATLAWFLLIPFGAYLFLERKYVFIYSIYILLLFAIAPFIVKKINVDVLNMEDPDMLVYSDIFVFIAMTVVFVVGFHYHDKFRKMELMEELQTVHDPSEEKDKLETSQIISTVTNTKNIHTEEKYTILFKRIEHLMQEKELYKDFDLNISVLSSFLQTNSTYIAKAIKTGGYLNFNHYLNKCRVEKVKKMIEENDLSRVTLMYIYTASGFSNQSTFNRSFKQIEGITPSEYIHYKSGEDKSLIQPE